MMYVDNVESMVGAEKRRNIPYDENAMYIAAGVQVLNLVGTSEGGGDSEQDKLFKVTQDLKKVFGSHKSVTLLEIFIS